MNTNIRSRVLAAGAVAGGIWGFAGYFILWGYTSLTVTRTFVLSPAGWAAFFPVRIVLLSIRQTERAAGRTFELSTSHRFIGVLAAMLGAAVGAIVAWLTARAWQRSRVRAAEAEPS